MKSKNWIFLVIIISSCASNKNWVQSSVKITEGLHDIEVINEKIAFAYSYGTGSIYKTFNGENNWEKIYQFDSIYFEQIQFLDEKNGWIIGSPNKIYSTEDGGKNWTNKSLQKEATDSYMYGMWFDNMHTGYIAALGRNKKGFSTTIYKTEDSGKSWNSINQIDEMILSLEKINGILYGTGNNTIMTNVDKKNWSYLFNDTTKQVGQIRDIEQNESGKLIATSFNGYIIEIEGQISQKKKITKNRIRNLISTNKNQWIAVGDNNKEKGNIFISNDNGETWNTIPKSLPDIHRIAKSNKKIWIVGKKGLVMTKKK